MDSPEFSPWESDGSEASGRGGGDGNGEGDGNNSSGDMWNQQQEQSSAPHHDHPDPSSWSHQDNDTGQTSYSSGQNQTLNGQAFGSLPSSSQAMASGYVHPLYQNSAAQFYAPVPGAAPSSSSAGGTMMATSVSGPTFDPNFATNNDSNFSGFSGFSFNPMGGNAASNLNHQSENATAMNNNNTSNYQQSQNPIPNNERGSQEETAQTSGEFVNHQRNDNQLLNNQPNSSPEAAAVDAAPVAVSLTTTPNISATSSNNNHAEMNAHQQAAPAPPKPPPPPPPLPATEKDDGDGGGDSDFIEILSDDGGTNEANAKRQRISADGTVSSARVQFPVGVPAGQDMASYQSRTASLPNWMKEATIAGASAFAAYGQPPQHIRPGQTISGYNNQQPPQMNAMSVNRGYGYGYQQPATNGVPYFGATAAAQAAVPAAVYANTNTAVPLHYKSQAEEYHTPIYVDLPSEFTPTWEILIPPSLVKPPPRKQKKAFQLSLVSLSEFTITGLAVSYDGPPTPVAGLRAVIKRISREHGNATFEKDAGGVGGRWKIPVGAYHAFVAYLKSDPTCIRLEQIPQLQLKIASLGRARMEKDYPTAEKLMERGVPEQIATALAPFQRGGVDFVLEREGRALIADEMGLGKSIQSIASMSVYHKEWPLLVLTPSGARYHWESEFRSWLGENGASARKLDEFAELDGMDSKPAAKPKYNNGGGFPLLKNSEIHVLTSSKVDILPPNARVVICSYGLAPMLAENGAMQAGMFPCAIADESHMLKNIKSKRTKFLLPILNACSRVVLLSGTPALSKPVELWPQLQILRTETHGFWDDENDFIDKYVKNGSSERRAELHAMLTGTVMIRRMKDNILKDMPRKVREKAILKIESPEIRRQMQRLMELLRQGKGVLAGLAKQHTTVVTEPEITPQNDEQTFQQLLASESPVFSSDEKEAILQKEMIDSYQQQLYNIRHAISTTNHQLNSEQLNTVLQQTLDNARSQLQVQYLERLHLIRGGEDGDSADDGEPPSRSSVLSQMYSLTGKSKVPAIADFVKRWLADPTKGKLCLFGHHIWVLDEIKKETGLSNNGEEGTFKFIRIDGKTSPRARQEQIDAFQTDPSIRVALLGITAAGVAVTLTAASQVIFAELFWTPAIMIQAEDRCHRIGQQARVHCMYFVASGTLDDVLWKLIEKKFKELGEFVEGKEKLKMVVHKIFKNAEELNAVFDKYDESDDDGDDDDFQADQVGSGDEMLPLDNDLQNVIEDFGKEEQAMLFSADNDDDEQEAEPMVNGVTAAVETDNGPGRSEDDAIALSDSSDEEGDDGKTKIIMAVDPENIANFNFKGALPQAKMYKMWQRDQALGVEIATYRRRLVVSRKLPARMQALGNDCYPQVGDILVGIGGLVMPHVHNLDKHLAYIKECLKQAAHAPVLLWFADDESFKDHYLKFNSAFINKKREGKKAEKSDGDVIDLLDD